MSDMQAELLALRGHQRRARQPGPDARIPDTGEASGDCDSHILTNHGTRGPNTPVNNTNPNNMTPESIQAMIDQALLRNSTNGDGSHSQGTNGSSIKLNVFKEHTLICTKFVANETEKVDKYISGLPENIYGNVKSARPKTLDKTIELANDLMDQKLRTYAERQSDNKRKAEAGKGSLTGGSLPSATTVHLTTMGPVAPRNATSATSRAFLLLEFACRKYCNTMLLILVGNWVQLPRECCFEVEALWHFKRDSPK
ncbi:hypothetical protein Tco_1409494 [Tanacetum coccineum]